jgi:hypothetical protein
MEKNTFYLQNRIIDRQTTRSCCVSGGRTTFVTAILDFPRHLQLMCFVHVHAHAAMWHSL